MKFAAIDVGSNAVRLLVSEINKKDGEIIAEKTSLVRVPLRLGDESFNTGFITTEKIESLVNTFKSFKYLIAVYNPVDYIAVGTSALREAKNRDEVIKTIEDETSIKIQIIDGIKEAEFLSLHKDIKDYYLNIDVGGGSTEATLSKENKLLDLKSFKIGTVRILNGKDKFEEWEKMNNYIRELSCKHKDIALAGSGGNINKLSKLFGSKDSKELSFEQLYKGVTHLDSMSLYDRMYKMGLRHDRADVIVPAGKIFLNIMKTLGSEKIIIPRTGLTDSLIRFLYRKNNS
jgi:exopolyphosphatase / guanosine-5'-triphosphate,3'-diphosphate pyrophosphatase